MLSSYLVAEIYQLNSLALKAANKLGSSSNGAMFSKPEIEWFFQNACILALEDLAFPHSRQIVQLLDVSTKVFALSRSGDVNNIPNSNQFATLYQQHDLTPEEKTNILSHYLLCYYFRTVRIVSEAHRQSDIDQKVQHSPCHKYISNQPSS